jgi:DHA1 family bicyclomycin/chloramphenicol resistance-like MFS transporter
MPSPKPLGQAEFIALIAMLFASVAFSIDAMLPALSGIAAELTPESPNRAQLIITSFVLGMGVGTLFAGPLADSFGRKPVILWGTALYAGASVAAMLAPTLDGVLAARVVQGLGVAGPRIVSMAIIRDQYAGRQMARIMSFAMMIFTLVPAVAPLVGEGIIAVAGWRGIFGAFLVFALVIALWLGLRQPETLAPADRVPFRAAPVLHAAGEVLAHPVVRLSILVQTLIFGALFATLSSIQPVFEVTFDRAGTFALWFAVIALVSGLASLLNARVVVRLGMRTMVRLTLEAQLVLSGVMAAGTLAGLWPEGVGFAVFLVWSVSVFMMAGLALGNVNAMAMEPMGHIAGTAASVVSAIATVGAVAIAVPIGLAFDGTPGPLATGVLLSVLAARVVLARIPR